VAVAAVVVKAAAVTVVAAAVVVKAAVAATNTDSQRTVKQRPAMQAFFMAFPALVPMWREPAPSVGTPDSRYLRPSDLL